MFQLWIKDGLTCYIPKSCSSCVVFISAMVYSWLSILLCGLVWFHETNSASLEGNANQVNIIKLEIVHANFQLHQLDYKQDMYVYSPPSREMLIQFLSAKHFYDSLYPRACTSVNFTYLRPLGLKN